MNLKSKFIQSLVVLAAAIPAAPALASAAPHAAAASSVKAAENVTFAANLLSKLDDARPIDGLFGRVWVRSDFVEIQAAPVPIAQAKLSPTQAFESLKTRASQRRGLASARLARSRSPRFAPPR
jgi:hypothetical protein